MVKIARNTLPDGHTRNDFKAFGPVATKDCDFEGCKMADLGHFSQEEVDSNKYYFISVVQSTKNSKWYSYFEWGRTRPDAPPEKPSYQFTECASEQDAADVCLKQFNDKNTKRGVWEKIGSKERFISKPGKDAYVVRPTATRMVGLPCAENIANENAKGDNVAAVATTKTIKKTTRKIDAPTKKLFKDLLGGAVKYANAVMSGGSGKATLPTQHAIVDARDILQDAMGRIKVVGNDLNAQLADVQLKKLTYALYGMVPKAKPIGASEIDWLLTQNNITGWNLDLDVFETALQGNEIKIEEEETDVMQGIPADVNYIPESDSIYKWLAPWWVNATRNRHGGVGNLKIKNLWAVERHNDKKIMRDAQEKTVGEMPKSWNNERPLHQTIDRPDLNAAERKLFHTANTALMFHGTRSVNVPGIVRESLRFPNQLTGVIITGAMFGPGSYFADDWKKSAGYCSSPRPGRSSYYGGGGEVQGRNAFMFAFDVICGNPHVAPDAYGFTQPPKGHHCVYGKAGHTASWGRHGGLLNNEWIIYQRGRIEMRYLAEIEY
jgi:hypothetical protein